MSLLDYIREFLHDTESSRWSDEYLNYLIGLAKNDIQNIYKAFITTRTISREKANLNSLNTEDFEITIQLEDGKYIYDLPNYLYIKSVRYNDIFIVHDYTLDINTVKDRNLIKCYNIESMKKDKLLIYPIPSKSMKLTKDEVIEIMKDFDYSCTSASSSEIEQCLNKNEIIDNLKTYGWGLNNKVIIPVEYKDEDFSPIKPNKSVEEENTTCNNLNSDITIEFNLGTLYVTLVKKKIINFLNNDDEILSRLLFDEHIKNYVCSVILLSDEDSVSLNLGNKELEKYNRSIKQVLDSYLENYDVNDILEIKSKEGNNYDLKINDNIREGLSNSKEKGSNLNEKRLDNELRKANIERKSLEVDEKGVELKQRTYDINNKKTELAQEELKRKECANKFGTTKIKRI